METYLAEVRQLHANPDVPDEAFPQRYAELTHRYPDLFPPAIGEPVEPSPDSSSQLQAEFENN